jgi:hypothetical protein
MIANVKGPPPNICHPKDNTVAWVSIFWDFYFNLYINVLSYWVSRNGWFVEQYPKQDRDFRTSNSSSLHCELVAKSALEDSTLANNSANISDEVAYGFVQTDQLPLPYAIALDPHKARGYTLGVDDKNPSNK